jgi:hypothetical protein
MADKKDLETIYQGLSYGGIAFGALAVLAPGVFTAIYGLKGDGNLRAMVRLWGTRNALLGALTITTKDPQVRRQLVTGVVGMTFADAALTLTSGSDVSPRGRVLGAATSAAFGAGGSYWLSQASR